MEQLGVNSKSLSVGRINFLHNLRTSHNLLMKFSCVILFMSCMINVHSADPHYEKITNLYSEIKPGVPTRDKLRNMIEILKTTSSIPEGTNYTIEEINKVLDIVLDIVERNKSILRNEEAIYKLACLLKDKNLKEDVKEWVKLIKIVKANKIPGRAYVATNVDTEIKTVEVFFDLKYYNSYMSGMKLILKKLRSVMNLKGQRRFVSLALISVNKIIDLDNNSEQIFDFLYFCASNIAQVKIDESKAIPILKHIEKNGKSVSKANYYFAVKKMFRIYLNMNDKKNTMIYFEKLEKLFPNNSMHKILLTHYNNLTKGEKNEN